MLRNVTIATVLVFFILSGNTWTQVEEADNMILIHKSVGDALIKEGNVRGLFNAYNSAHGTNFQFWDHDNNAPVLTDPQGGTHGDYGFPEGGATQPEHYENLFKQPVHVPPDNAFSRLLANHEVILFKSCSSAAFIEHDHRLNQIKNNYRAIRDVMDDHRDHLFIPFSPPPLNKDAPDTPPEMGARARAFADWLKTDFLTEKGPHPNIAVFDFFDLLAEDDPSDPGYNFLRSEYVKGWQDSHPNKAANEHIAPIFVDFVINSIKKYAKGTKGDVAPRESRDRRVTASDTGMACSIALSNFPPTSSECEILDLAPVDVVDDSAIPISISITPDGLLTSEDLAVQAHLSIGYARIIDE